MPRLRSITKPIRRDQFRQRWVNFLSPEQWKKWDAEVSKAKEVLAPKNGCNPALSRWPL